MLQCIINNKKGNALIYTLLKLSAHAMIMRTYVCSKGKVMLHVKRTLQWYIIRKITHYLLCEFHKWNVWALATNNATRAIKYNACKAHNNQGDIAIICNFPNETQGYSFNFLLFLSFLTPCKKALVLWCYFDSFCQNSIVEL